MTMVWPAATRVAADLEQILHDDDGEPLERLVEQNQARAADQGARDRQHLLLAAGQRPAVAAAPFLSRGKIA